MSQHNSRIEVEVTQDNESVLGGKYDGDKYRLINSDGTFNIVRKGLSGANLYEQILSMSWSKIILIFFGFYFTINCLFALLFMIIGIESIQGIQGVSWVEHYVQMIYFSIQTFTTVGYGQMSPMGNMANLLSAFIAFIGLISFAILTGLSFAKFSKPRAHILFSKNMLIAPNPLKGNAPSLQFRIVNTSKNQIIDLQARVTLAWLEEESGVRRRKFKRLELELENIHLFPLNWTLVHPINEDSPLAGKSLHELLEKQMEVLILVKGFDDTYSQIVHSKRSYSCKDLVEGGAFEPMYEISTDKTILHLTKLDRFKLHKF